MKENMKEQTSRYRLILYDLDGTLLDSFEDIRRAVNYGVEELGLGPYTLKEVMPWVGRGVVALVTDAVGEGNEDRILPANVQLTTNLVILPNKVVMQQLQHPIMAMVIENQHIVVLTTFPD